MGHGLQLTFVFSQITIFLPFPFSMVFFGKFMFRDI